ncbi:hypothetical protein BC938DRAFT_483540 [Jimgerdemannia flammicorona]|uniref:Uncharacterized protein n=1 Tax=Jimgerdemannia flammicorona TaxID=994334 RepID=A0A433R065_9FUNG|nr:hypothetical protein BC938DRAFT_483540 [Jimgerdemannia flammicorona]
MSHYSSTHYKAIVNYRNGRQQTKHIIEMPSLDYFRETRGSCRAMKNSNYCIICREFTVRRKHECSEYDYDEFDPGSDNETNRLVLKLRKENWFVLDAGFIKITDDIQKSHNISRLTDMIRTEIPLHPKINELFDATRSPISSVQEIIRGFIVEFFNSRDIINIRIDEDSFKYIYFYGDLDDESLVLYAICLVLLYERGSIRDDFIHSQKYSTVKNHKHKSDINKYYDIDCLGDIKWLAVSHVNASGDCAIELIHCRYRNILKADDPVDRICFSAVNRAWNECAKSRKKYTQFCLCVGDYSFLDLCRTASALIGLGAGHYRDESLVAIDMRARDILELDRRGLFRYTVDGSYIYSNLVGSVVQTIIEHARSLNDVRIDFGSIRDRGRPVQLGNFLAVILATVDRLSRLTVNDCMLAYAIIPRLCQPSTLTHLNLRYGNHRFDIRWLSRMADHLKYNTTLRQLNLQWNCIGDDGAFAIAKSLRTNTTLTSLNLGWNRIQDRGAVELAYLISGMCQLQELNIEGNCINTVGATAISESLKTNQSLQILNLSSNNIHKDGAIALARCLVHNCTLKRLYIYGNYVGDECAIEFAKSLMYGANLHRAMRDVPQFFDLHATRQIIQNNLINNTNGHQTLLHQATRQGLADAVDVLLNVISVNSTNLYSATPLHIVAHTGALDIFNRLIQAPDADLNARDNFGATPLHVAVSMRHHGIVHRLLNIHGVRTTIKNVRCRTPLQIAIEQGDLDICRLFMNRGQIIHRVANRGTLLHIAVDAGKDHIVRELVSHMGADVNAIDMVHQRPIHHAVVRQNTLITAMLIHELGADINAKDQYGWTPLHHAAVAQRSDCTHILLQHVQIDPNVQNYKGYTPLHMSVLTGSATQQQAGNSTDRCYKQHTV